MDQSLGPISVQVTVTPDGGDPQNEPAAVRVQVTLVWNDLTGVPVEPLKLTGCKYRLAEIQP